MERYYNFGGEGVMAAAGAKTVLEVNAPVIDHEGSAKARIDRALLVEPMRRWRERICARADLIVTPSAAILPRDTPSRKILRLEWGADTDRFLPDAPGTAPFERPATTVAIFAGAFRSWHGAVNLVRAVRELHTRGRADVGAVLVGDGPELPAVQDEAAGLANVVFTGAVPHANMPSCLAAADIGVAPFDIGAHRPLSLGFYWSPLKIFEYMAAGLPVVAPAVDRIPSLVADGREGLLYDPSSPGALARALERLGDPSLRRPLGRAARERAVREVQLEGPLRCARQRDQESADLTPAMRVLLATDSFPPVCGGSGWSTYELARGLLTRGHDVIVAQPKPGTPHGRRQREYAGIRVLEFGFPAPSLPYVRNYFKNERLYPALADALSEVITTERVDLVHGQHVLTCLPSIDAAHRHHLPAVCTVRDYWPVCYWSDLIYSRSGASLCPECSAGMMTRCIRPRGGPIWPIALPMIPYMRANLARKRSGLAAADAIVAVSTTIASDLRARAPEIAATRLEIVPNPVDVAGLRAKAASSAPPIQGPYALYLGKLAPNKGTSHLVDIVERARLEWPLVIVGDGPDRAAIDGASQTVGTRHPARRMGRSVPDDGLARARIGARLPLTRPRVAEPRAPRSERPRRTDCRDEHRRHARHREARRDRTPLVVSGSPGRRRAAPGRERTAGAAARRSGPHTCRAHVRCRRRRAGDRSLVPRPEARISLIAHSMGARISRISTVTPDHAKRNADLADLRDPLVRSRSASPR